jgi:threonine aldolase
LNVVDLRSDTVTKPTPAMRKAMAEADVGDDVYGEDPTTNRLQQMMAERLGKEASLFVVSGSMANQVAVRVHTRAGDEVIVDGTGHSFLYESGGLAGISHVQANPLPGVRGLLTAEQIEAAIRPPWDHYARTSMVIVENTSNGGGGTLYELSQLAAIGDLAKRRGLAFHLDGARLWNACVKSGASMAALAASADSVSVCFSKGLGAPIGSVVAGSRAFIEEAHRQRKMLGGGMRQVGVLAAAAIYAVEHHVDRLEQDHENLRRLAEGLARIDGLSIDPSLFPTNIAYVKTEQPASEVATKLRAAGVLVNAMGPNSIRAVTHLEVDSAAIDLALERFRKAIG